MDAIVRRLVLTAVAAVAGLGGGWLCAVISVPGQLLPRPKDYPFLVEYVPLPHHVPEHQGGAAFRFAMVYDVIHERFAKHGPAHYHARNRQTRDRLALLSP